MWLNPVMLWGLTAVSVPIIIHIISFFRQRRQPWAAMALLNEALQQRQVQVRMEDRLLMLLRCLALAFLALSFARPVVNTPGMGGDSGAVLLLVDGSYSMSHGAGMTRFDAARIRAREVLATLPAGTPITIALMGKRLMGSEGQVICRNQALDHEVLRHQLDAASPLAEPFDPAACAADMLFLLDELPFEGGARREIYVITDAQARDWRHPDESWRAALEEAALEARIYVLTAGGELSENVALVSFSLAGGEPRRGALARFEAIVRNYGERTRYNVPVTLSINGQTIFETVIPELPSGGEDVAWLPARFAEAGLARVTATVGPDEMTIDNQRSLVVLVRSADGVLVTADPSDSWSLPYIRASLEASRASGQSAAGISVRGVLPDDLATVSFTGIDAVFVADAPRLPLPAVQRLAQFAYEGGGVAFFAGPSAIPEIWNTWSGPGGRLLPAALGEILSDANPAAEQPARAADAAANDGDGGEGGDGDGARPAAPPRGWRLRADAGGHPLAAAVSALPAELVDEFVIRQRWSLAARTDPDDFAGAPETALWLAPEPGQSVSEPWVVGGRYGHGRVAIFGAPPNRRWSDWPLTATFPVIMNRLAGWLATQDYESPRLVRETIDLALPEPRFSQRVVVTDPAGRHVTLEVGRERGRPGLHYENTGRPGYYAIQPAPETGHAFARPDDDQPPLAVAVNIDAASGESDARVLPDDEFASLLREWPVRVFGRSEDNISDAIRESRAGREISAWLLLAATCLFLMESFLAFRFGRRL